MVYIWEFAKPRGTKCGPTIPGSLTSGPKNGTLNVYKLRLGPCRGGAADAPRSSRSLDQPGAKQGD